MDLTVNRRGSALDRICCGVMLALTTALYVPAKLFSGQFTLLGFDYLEIHRLRLEYAQQFLRHHFCLPGWYTSEFLGIPFWSNIHSFCWFPSHLILLLFDPSVAFNVGVWIAAILASGSMYLYGRSFHLSPVAAAVAGWTYSASGFFASRVMAGQLLMFESYFTLPLLLWSVEKIVSEPTRRSEIQLLIIMCITLLAGHPQFPAYAILTAILYALIRLDQPQRWRIITLTSQAALLVAFMWLPFLLLLSRSTKILHLPAANNNIFFPLNHLSTYFFPWSLGSPPAVAHLSSQPFLNSDNPAVYWDTVCYVGWLPWAAFVGCAYAAFQQRRRRDPMMFFICLGILSLLTALPAHNLLFDKLSGTFFRSPARQIYLLNFSLIIACGVFLKYVETDVWPRSPVLIRILIIVAIGAHVVNLFCFSRAFIVTREATPVPTPRIDAYLADNTVGTRVAIDRDLFISANRHYDDIGFYDAVTLARPYQNIVLAASANKQFNNEQFYGSWLSSGDLAKWGVSTVVTSLDKPNFPKQFEEKSLKLYSVPNPVPRTAFFSTNHVQLVDQTHVETGTVPDEDLTPSTTRVSPDEIRVQFRAPSSGYIQFIETSDIGWRAQRNQQDVPLLCSNGTLMAIPVEAGDVAVRLSFSTPGKWPGILISLIGLLWVLVDKRKKIVELHVI